MYNSTLQRKTPLKAKTQLRANRSIRDSYADKLKRKAELEIKHRPTKKPAIKPLKQKAYKPSYPYRSILTDDLKKCIVTGDTDNIHIHHIFGASNKANSEKYGFLVPLRADWHDMADYGIHFNKEMDLRYKRMCEEYFLGNYGSKEDFIREFGKWW